MKKRLKKKYGNKYALLKKAVRQNKKRKGYKCLGYKIIPIGKRDINQLIKVGWGHEISWATHWFIRLHEANDPYFFENRIYYVIYVYFSTVKGGTNIQAPYYMNFYSEDDKAFVQSKFERIAFALETDQFEYQMQIQ